MYKIEVNKIQLFVSIDQGNPQQLELETDYTIKEVSNYIVQLNNQDSHALHYRFYYDKDYQNELSPSQTVMNCELIDNSIIFGQGVYAFVKCIIIKNQQEVCSINMRLDKSVREIIKLIQDTQNINIEVNDSLSLVYPDGQSMKLTNLDVPIWQFQIYDTFTISFKVKVEELLAHQQEFENQIVSITNNGQTVTYQDKVRLIEATFHHETFKPTLVKLRKADAAKTFVLGTTHVIFLVGGKGIYIYWDKKDGKTQFKFSSECI